MTLNSAEEAIKQAEEAGDYQTLAEWNQVSPSTFLAYLTSNTERTLQDPAFWKALGKVRGWHDGKTGVCMGCGQRTDHTCTCHYAVTAEGMPNVQSEWYYHALRYFETRFANGNLTAYWQSLP
jgi:hypothetical protein